MGDWLNSRVFSWVHGNNLVYNACWEDPRLDHAALQIGAHDNLLVITSAGCNVLDYALAEPHRIAAVDVNPRQNALLELKLAGIRQLEFDDFFQMFGRGRLPNILPVYTQKLRGELSRWSQAYWDRWIGFFDHPCRGFYYRGTSGAFAHALRWYAERVLGIREWLDAILAAESVDEQSRIYDQHLRERFWTRTLKFAMGRDTMLSLVGVPRAQREQVERHYDGGIVRFVQDCVEAVFARLPLADNYFWRVYLTGEYTANCCPEYLRPANFQRLKAGLIDRISVHCGTVQAVLEKSTQHFSRFVLLDHMDWLSSRGAQALAAEWQAILDRRTHHARVIWRSGGLRTEFVDRLQVRHGGGSREVGELLRYHPSLAAALHQRDRVHTYGSFSIADIVT